MRLPYPSDDTRLITQAALAGLEQIYRTGYAFSKAEVLLLDLCQRGEYTDDLFVSTQPEASRQVMAVLDAVNAKWGRGDAAAGRGTTDAGVGYEAGDDESEFYDGYRCSLTRWRIGD